MIAHANYAAVVIVQERGGPDGLDLKAAIESLKKLTTSRNPDVALASIVMFRRIERHLKEIEDEKQGRE